MSRLQTRYVCQECGNESPKWMGRCPECEAWDSFVEEVVRVERAPGSSARGSRGSSGAIGPIRAGAAPIGLSAPVAITDVAPTPQHRLSSGIEEFDRVLGGGLVPGGLILVGGDPGIGKSTLLTQVAYRVAAGLAQHIGIPEEAATPLTVLYISGEESAHQIKLRGERLRAEAPGFLVSVETEIGAILRHLQATQPALAVVDSIQTISDAGLESAPGSVSQVRGCAHYLARFAKSSGVPVVLIGHVTKEGSLAGPRVLEHIVDTVLYFEGDRHHAYRLLRAVKNRFGSTDELGIFEMRESGLEGVANPSAALLAERPDHSSGSAVAAAIEGSRALLVEVQALTARSSLASPRRAVTGMDQNRVSTILAVLEKRLGLKIAEQDVFVNVAGGIRVGEPAIDLATAAAIASSFREQPVEPTTVLLGEVGLAGEVRAVSQVEKRIREAARLGFKRAIVSKQNAARLSDDGGLTVVGAGTVLEALTAALLPAQA